MLKEFFIRGKRSLVVTGTHGKTTTTSLLTWVFEHNGLNPSYLIGGIPNNLGQGARFTDSEWFIIEGDEYDTAFFDKRSKFVHYLPEVGDHQQPRVRSRRHLRETSTPSRPPSSISSGSSRATACCWATATTRTSRRCST